MSCCSQSITIVQYGLNHGSLGLLLNLFLTGLVGSFTHCIGMCGPIAISQMSMRLMHLSKNQMNQQNKFLCAASIPYYIGKSISYTVLSVSWFYLVSLASDNQIAKLLGAVIMILSALFFIASAFSINFSFMPQWGSTRVVKVLTNKLTRLASVYSNDPFGINGWILGILFGLIPCGLVYAAATTAVSYSKSGLVTGVAMFLFGLGTIPGLFLISYLGESLLIKWHKLFAMIYFLSMLFNAYLLLSAAWHYLSDFYSIIK